MRHADSAIRHDSQCTVGRHTGTLFLYQSRLCQSGIGRRIWQHRSLQYGRHTEYLLYRRCRCAGWYAPTANGQPCCCHQSLLPSWQRTHTSCFRSAVRRLICKGDRTYRSGQRRRLYLMELPGIYRWRNPGSFLTGIRIWCPHHVYIHLSVKRWPGSPDGSGSCRSAFVPGSVRQDGLSEDQSDLWLYLFQHHLWLRQSLWWQLYIKALLLRCPDQ